MSPPDNEDGDKVKPDKAELVKKCAVTNIQSRFLTGPRDIPDGVLVSLKFRKQQTSRG